MFQYKTSSDDFVNTLSTDITYKTHTTKWYDGNIMKQVGVTTDDLVATDVSGGVHVPTSRSLAQTFTIESVRTNSNIARDLMKHIAYDIFGQTEGGLDMFSNESEMLTSLEQDDSVADSCSKEIATAIDSLLDASHTAGSTGDKSSTNFAHQILTQILADETRRATAVSLFDNAHATNAADIDIDVPLAADDEIVFNISIAPTFGAGSTSSGHGIGTAPVSSRIYQITLVLKA
jgi:hypothetical protein